MMKYLIRILKFFTFGILLISSNSDAKNKFQIDLKKNHKRDYKIYLKNYTENNIKKYKNPYKLTDQEGVAIYGYTLDMYKILNTSLRSHGKITPHIESYVKTLNSALKKIPPYSGVVKRATTLPLHILMKYKKGAIVSDPAYTSSSIKTRFPGKHHLNIKSKTGRLINLYSSMPEDSEVLFLPSTKFKIVNIVRNKGVNTIFELVEI